MALKPLNSVGGFSVGEVPANVILPNADITVKNGTFSGNLLISNVNSNWGILTDNLYYSNGTPWDLQLPGGSNTQIQFNDENAFGGSANFTFDKNTNILTVVGNSQFNNANLGNLATANFVNVANTINGNVANFSGNLSTSANLSVTGNASVTGNVSGNNASFAGNVGATGNVSGNNASFAGNVGATGNVSGNNASFVSNVSANNLSATANLSAGNASLGNLVTANFVYASNLVRAPQLESNVANGTTPLLVSSTTLVANLNADLLDGYNSSVTTVANTVVVRDTNGGITSNYFIGNVTAPVVSGGTGNGNIQLNVNVTIGANNVPNVAEFTENGLTITDNLTATNGNFTSNLNVTNTAIVGNLRTNNLLYANGQPWDLQEAAGANTQIQYNIGNNFAASANFTYNDTTQLLTVLGNIQSNNANLGNLATANFFNVANNLSVTGNASVTGNVSGNNASFAGNLSATGNLSGNNATLVSNVSANNLSATANLSAGNASITSNLSAGNASITANLSTGNLSVTGNLSAGNFIGTFANGNSNVKIYENSNVEISVAGNANVATVTGTGFIVVGKIQTSIGNIEANGNISANGLISSVTANVSGQANVGSLLTSNITSNGNLYVNTTGGVGGNESIILAPRNLGTVDVSGKRISSVADPSAPNDAATKEYVDSVAQGLTVHTAVRVTSGTNLNATYTSGGTSLTTDAINSNKIITFSAPHGLSIGDELYWTNTFNGIIQNNAYFVFSIPTSNQITVKNGFYGTEVTTLTDGTGLSQPAFAETGIGATLTNAGTNAAISIDGIALALNNRVLVQGQTNQTQNGVYVVTTVGDGSTPWVLTRATTEDTYDPKATTGLAYGDYFFVQQGTNYAGSSYVLTSPIGEIVFGVTNIEFTQFSAAGSYTAGNGIAITGTTISANVDNDTTAIVSGNITVKVGANLATPNITDGTFSSLTWNNSGNGNVTANNLSISNIANITGNLTVTNNVQVNGTISSNSNVSGLNLTTAGNVTANNAAITTLLTVPTANVSNVVNAGNVSVTLALTGNTANFTGNLITANANLGNLATANFFNIANNLSVTGNISAANASFTNTTTTNLDATTVANIGNLNVTSNVVSNLTPNANLTLDLGSSTQRWQDIYAGNIDASGNFVISGNISANTYTANIITANTQVNIGDTGIRHGNITTTSTALQTISSVATSGIFGIEWLVRGVDNSGTGKYTVATVTAVTNGTTVDYSVFGGVTIGSTTGTLEVNIVGSNLELQVTPSSSNSTVWVTQYRTI